MKEIIGELWDYYQKPNTVILITTNGVVKGDGTCVMGRGCALEATQKIPGIARKIGEAIQRYGNVPNCVCMDLWTFPVKHKWWQKADINLIAASAEWLGEVAGNNPERTFILPRPGCGNGHLLWKDVKPVLAAYLPDNVLVISK